MPTVGGFGRRERRTRLRGGEQKASFEACFLLFSGLWSNAVVDEGQSGAAGALAGDSRRVGGGSGFAITRRLVRDAGVVWVPN